MPAIKYSFAHYLTSKVSVDARSFNQGVWEQLIDRINNSSKQYLQVLEVGAGIGTMGKKIADEFPKRSGSYVMLEPNADLLEAAKINLAKWADEIEENSESQWGPLLKFQAKKDNWRINFLQMDIQTWLTSQNSKDSLNAVVGHAILDLLDSENFLTALYPLLADDAILYFPINYDGLSIFEPIINAELDEKIWHYYNESMDLRKIAGKSSGDSQSGRHLFQYLTQAGLDVIAAGSSDWVIFPKNNQYLNDEKYFLQHIVKTIEDELLGHPLLDKNALRNWIIQRKQQILSGKLIYIAHQMDALAIGPSIETS